MPIHTVRILLIFSVKSCEKTWFCLNSYTAKTMLLRKTPTSNSFQAYCSNENCNKFCKLSFCQVLCRTKPHIWSLEPKMWKESLVKNLNLWKNWNFYWLWGSEANILKRFWAVKLEYLRSVYHKNLSKLAFRGKT